MPHDTRLDDRDHWNRTGYWLLAQEAVSSKVLLTEQYYGILVLWYQVRSHMLGSSRQLEIKRIQTGVRMEKRLVKVLKAVAELRDMTLGDLLEGIVLHAFEGKTAFSAGTLKEIEQFKKIFIWKRWPLVDMRQVAR